MGDYEHSAIIHATPDATFDYVSDPRHMPEYVATMIEAIPGIGDRIRVAADIHGQREEGEAILRSDPAARRLEWGGGHGSDYHGWMTVSAGDNGSTARVTIHLAAKDEEDRPEIEGALRQTLTNIDSAISRG